MKLSLISRAVAAVTVLFVISATGARAELCVQNSTTRVVRILRAADFHVHSDGRIEIVSEGDRRNLAPAELVCMPNGKDKTPEARRLAFRIHPEITDVQHDALAPEFYITELPLPHDASASIAGDVDNPRLTVQSGLKPIKYGKLVRVIDRKVTERKGE